MQEPGKAATRELRGHSGRGWRISTGLTVLVAAVAFGAVWGLPAMGGPPSVAPTETATASPPPTAITPLTLPTVISHVIVVMEENHDLAWTLTDPTFKSIYNNNAHATHAYAVCHPSAPNYLGATDAMKQQCGSDGVSYYNSSNLASDASAHSLGWQGLYDSMPSACDRSDSYPYIAHHNSWIYYSNLKTGCSSHDLPFLNSSGSSRLKQQISASSLPALTFISPNMLHDAHDGTLSAASSWLQTNVLGPIKNSTTYSKNTAIFVVFDEAYKQSCGCSENGGYTSGGVTVSGGPIYLAVVSPIPPVTLGVTTNVTFFNIVSTVEWLLGLPSLGHSDNSHFASITGLFK